MRRLDWLKLWLHGLLLDVSPPPVACANGLGGGLGVGLRRSGGGRAVTLASLLGPNGAWWDFRDGTLLTTATQPTLVDGDCDDYTQWIGQNDPVLSNETAAPATGTCMRVAYGGTNYPRAVQNILTIGLRYRVRGRARGDGTYAPRVYDSVAVWSGTVSTDWQYFDVEFTATAVSLKLYAMATGAGFCEFDDVTIDCVSVTSAAAKVAGGTLAGSTLAQATPANMPWEVNSGIKFAVGTGDGLYLSSATGANCIHNGLGGTLALHYNMLNTVGIQVFAGTVQGNAKGFSLYESSGNLVLRIGNGVGYVYNNTAVGVVSTGKNIIILRTSNTDGISLRLNGVERLSGAMVGATTDNSIYPLGLGNVPDGSAYAPDAILQDVVLVDYAISDIQCEELEEYWS